MKIIFSLISIMLFVGSAHSQTDFNQANAEKYRWLFESLFQAKDRTELPAETFKSFEVHLKDTYQSFPAPSEIAAINLKPGSHIEGGITYVSIVKKKYSYDVLQTPESLVFNVRIYLKNATAEDRVEFSKKVQVAEDMWNENRIETDFNYRFKFDIVSDPSQARYSVFILNTTRGPYDVFWGRDWTGHTLAHEIGHMMGLGDEYETLSGKFDCFKPSLMCTAWTGSLMPHHYYFILRRLVNSKSVLDDVQLP
jgi:hypothetical protein